MEIRKFDYRSILLACIYTLSSYAWGDEPPSSGTIIAKDAGTIISKDIASVSEKIGETTHDQQKESQLKFIHSRLKCLIPIGANKVLFSFDGMYGINTQNGWVNDFVIGTEDHFNQALMGHGSTTFTVREVLEDMVKIMYQSEFDHTSFGSDKITIDVGEISVKYTNQGECSQ